MMVRNVKRVELSLTKDEMVTKYTPLINKLAYQFYSKYFTIIDFHDAKQEVLVCFQRCLDMYDYQKSTFIHFFYTSYYRLRSRYYHSHKNSIHLNINTVHIPINSEDVERENICSMLDMYSYKRSSTCRRIELKYLISDKHLPLYEIFLSENKISKHLIHKKLGVSRYEAANMLCDFKTEISQLREI